MTRLREDGFTLVETLIAMLVVCVGAFALHGAITMSARKITGSQDQFIASQRAAEAVESVFKARDNRVLTWAQIKNVLGANDAEAQWLPALLLLRRYHVPLLVSNTPALSLP
jgi:prepilin-type N-terminal cleavage/methylation domain-containing protein